MDDKVYTNQEIADTPFPNQPDNTTVTDSTPSSSNTKAAGQTTIPQQSFIQKNIAVETESQALNTRTKKIIQEFQFTPSGAIQIGDFKSAVTGDIRIDPNGIIARNFLGDTTFAIDGDTGDAIFKGIVQAADFTVIDSNGLISLSNFFSDQTSNTNQETTSTTFVDIGVSLTFTLIRDTHIMVGFDVTGRNDGNTPPPILSDFNNVGLVIDGVIQDPNHQLQISGSYFPNSGGGSTLLNQTGSLTQIIILGEGVHVLKLQMKTSNGGRGFLRFVNLYYVILGR